KGIVLSEQPDIPSPLFDPNEETQQIANNLLECLDGQVDEGRLPKSLAPIQSGVGSVANAVLNGMKDSQFRDLEIYSEVLQDGIFGLIYSGVGKFASASAFAVSKKRVDTLDQDLAKSKNHVVFRLQEITNNREMIRRLSTISFNTQIEGNI